MTLPPEYVAIELKPCTLWETVSTIQLVQALGTAIHTPEIVSPEQLELVWATGPNTLCMPNPGFKSYSLEYDKAYRLLEETQQPYVGVLASASGLTGLGIGVPQFPQIKPIRNKSIVLCPFPVKTDLMLPETVWRAVVHMLRSYNIRVYLLGASQQWQDECGYTEDDILSERSVEEKLAILAGAELVVGLPNEWSWAATYWDKKLIYLYPDNIPQRRWFPYSSNNFGRMVYSATQIQIPVIINQLRLLIGQM